MNELKPFTIYTMKGINYIGSTGDLRKRQQSHNDQCFGECKAFQVYQHIRQNFLKIELIPVAHIFVGDKARRMIEQVFIDKYDSIENGYNMLMAYRTSIEKKLHDKEYQEKNKERRKEYLKQNRERISTRGKAYYEKNKEKRNARAACPHCQKMMTKGSITRHIKKSCKQIKKSL